VIYIYIYIYRIMTVLKVETDIITYIGLSAILMVIFV